MSLAEKRMRSKSCVTARLRHTVQTHAAAAETIGAEKLVPSHESNPDGLTPTGTATGMSWPGAARSTERFSFEKSVGLFCSFVAAIVRTWLKLAGYSVGLFCWNSFPADATIREPCPKAASIASSSWKE